MINSITYFKYFVVIALLCLVGCATVPKEVVELSYTVGNDIRAIHVSYTNLIHIHFNDLRRQTNEFLQNRWVPVYLKDFIKRGELVKSASSSDPNLVLEDVQLWVEVTLEEIDAKKKELIDPINKDETELLGNVDEGFERIYRAISTITSHLNSLREVQEVQDEALQALQLKGLRDKINQGLIDASDKSMEAIENLKKTEKLLEETNEKKNELMKKVKGEEK